MTKKRSKVDTPTSRKRDMGEALLEQHSRSNVRKGKEVKNEDGSTSSVRSGSYQTDSGKERLIPHIYDGKEVGPKEANKRARGKAYPEYDTPEKATAASKRISSKLGGPARRGKPRK